MTSPRLAILLRSPELTLKGKNRTLFWETLRNNAAEALEARGLSWPVRRVRGRLMVRTRDGTPETLGVATEALARVAGVHSVVPAIVLERRQVVREGRVDRERLGEAALHFARESPDGDGAFAIRVRRVDKTFPLSSVEMERWLGSLVREKTSWDTVSLDAPDRSFHVDVHPDGVHVYGDRQRGVGGLPVGMSGSLLALLSGGIDSPVASHLMACRGCRVDWLHVSATAVSPEELPDSLPDRLARTLSRTTARSRLFVAPYTRFDLALAGSHTGHEALLFRRFLLRLGDAVAERIEAPGLVTGDSLGQVSSQTLENLIAVDRAVERPVLRPLVAWDKDQTIERARAIETYELSVEPYKDCCALYAREPRTRTWDETLRALEVERIPDYPRLLADTLDELVWAEYRCGERTAVSRGLGGPVSRRADRPG